MCPRSQRLNPTPQQHRDLPSPLAYYRIRVSRRDDAGARPVPSCPPCGRTVTRRLLDAHSRPSRSSSCLSMFKLDPFQALISSPCLSSRRIDGVPEPPARPSDRPRSIPSRSPNRPTATRRSGNGPPTPPRTTPKARPTARTGCRPNKRRTRWYATRTNADTRPTPPRTHLKAYPTARTGCRPNKRRTRWYATRTNADTRPTPSRTHLTVSPASTTPNGGTPPSDTTHPLTTKGAPSPPQLPCRSPNRKLSTKAGQLHVSVDPR